MVFYFRGRLTEDGLFLKLFIHLSINIFVILRIIISTDLRLNLFLFSVFELFPFNKSFDYKQEFRDILKVELK